MGKLVVRIVNGQVLIQVEEQPPPVPGGARLIEPQLWDSQVGAAREAAVDPDVHRLTPDRILLVRLVGWVRVWVEADDVGEPRVRPRGDQRDRLRPGGRRPRIGEDVDPVVAVAAVEEGPAGTEHERGGAVVDLHPAIGVVLGRNPPRSVPVGEHVLCRSVPGPGDEIRGRRRTVAGQAGDQRVVGPPLRVDGHGAEVALHRAEVHAEESSHLVSPRSHEVVELALGEIDPLLPAAERADTPASVARHRELHRRV
ncbi:MAG: hypothetical protein ACJ8CB_07080, partial [Ktedonobacteraceae bacterium]